MSKMQLLQNCAPEALGYDDFVFIPQCIYCSQLFTLLQSLRDLYFLNTFCMFIPLSAFPGSLSVHVLRALIPVSCVLYFSLACFPCPSSCPVSLVFLIPPPSVCISLCLVCFVLL